ncbi:MAG: hypothetical protein ACSNEK_04430 [Parachlamydiaceae bacterium]
MDKRDFTKLVLMGMAAGSLIGSQSLTAGGQECEANHYESMLAAGCGQGKCGGQKPPADNHTSDNADYTGHDNYGTGSSYYNKGATGGTNQGSGSGHGSSSNYSHPNASQTQQGSSSYYNTGSSNQYNRGAPPQGSGSSYEHPSSTSSYPSSFEQQKSPQQGRHLAADEGN